MSYQPDLQGDELTDEGIPLPLNKSRILAKI